MNKLRQRILTRLAQTTPTQPAQPSTTPATMPPPPAVPGDVFSHLAEGYNGATVPILTALTNKLNDALHYASGGKKSFINIIGNNLELSGLDPDGKHVGSVAQLFYNTFLNKKNAFTKKVDAPTITNWANTITNSPDYNSLSQINPTGTLAIKLQGNLKTEILNYMANLKQVNPLTP